MCLGGSSTPAPSDGSHGYLCPAGHSCPVGSAREVPCEPGTYSPAPGAACCLSCPRGTVCSSSGTKQPSLCPAGKDAKFYLQCQSENTHILLQKPTFMSTPKVICVLPGRPCLCRVPREPSATTQVLTICPSARPVPPEGTATRRGPPSRKVPNPPEGSAQWYLQKVMRAEREEEVQVPN